MLAVVVKVVSEFVESYAAVTAVVEIVAVGKTFGVAVRTPVLVAEEISDLFAVV